MAFAYDRAALAAVPAGVLPRSELPGLARWGRSGRAITVLSLVVADLLAVQAAILLGAVLSSAQGWTFVEAARLDLRVQIAALALPVGYYALDLYGLPRRAAVERFPLRIKATCILFGLLVGWSYSIGAHWPPAAIALAFLFAIALQFVGEGVVRSFLMRWGLWGIPAVVIGAGPTGRQLVRTLRAMPDLGLRPLALFDDTDSGDHPHAAVEGVPVLGPVAESARYSGEIGTAIVTMSASAPEGIGTIATRLGYRDVIVVPDLGDLPTLWVRASEFNGLIGLQIRRNLLLKRNRALKQIIDHLLALPLLVLSVPVIAVLALSITLWSSGSPFYVQMRAGKDGRPIKVWKLRTMYADADQRLQQHLAENADAQREWARYCKLSNDPRILPGIGWFLRRTSLDELPQIFNVVRGEMSLVGPRPFPSYHLERFDTSFRSLRASVMPGITGLWQVSARSDGDLQVQQALDTYYVRNWSIWIDFYILWRTVGAVLFGNGAR